MDAFFLPYPKHSAGAAVVMCGNIVVCDCSAHIKGAQNEADLERVNKELDEARKMAEYIVSAVNTCQRIDDKIEELETVLRQTREKNKKFDV